MRIRLHCKDLMTRTRLGSRWQAAGADLLRPHANEAPDLIVIDLGEPDAAETLAAERIRYPAARILVFGPHVEGEALRAAKAAGADEAVVRGKVAERVLRRLHEAD
ncbi:MAG: DNA-binding response regulator [Acidihalobacter sp.]|jgi:DNA-binding NarL/FixJ family response regulator